ncbi:MAG: transposase, partial [Longimicrobiales bacterium]
MPDLLMSRELLAGNDPNHRAPHQRGGAMRSARFTEEQILAVLAEGTSGMPILEVCQRHGITKTTYYRWKTQYG